MEDIKIPMMRGSMDDVGDLEVSKSFIHCMHVHNTQLFCTCLYSVYNLCYHLFTVRMGQVVSARLVKQEPL